MPVARPHDNGSPCTPSTSRQRATPSRMVANTLQSRPNCVAEFLPALTKMD